MKFTEFEMVCWQNTYMSLDVVDDRHSMFSHKLGVNRQTAKALCYEIMWSVPFMKPVMEDLVVLEEIRGVLSKGEIDE